MSMPSWPSQLVQCPVHGPDWTPVWCGESRNRWSHVGLETWEMGCGVSGCPAAALADEGLQPQGLLERSWGISGATLTSKEGPRPEPCLEAPQLPICFLAMYPQHLVALPLRGVVDCLGGVCLQSMGSS